jgi:hypothetical protein
LGWFSRPRTSRFREGFLRICRYSQAGSGVGRGSIRKPTVFGCGLCRKKNTLREIASGYVGILRKKYTARNPKIASGDHAARSGGSCPMEPMASKSAAAAQ